MHLTIRQLGLIGMLALGLSLPAIAAEEASVAVLDIVPADDSSGERGWAAGLASFLELALQDAGIAVYARKDIRYVLSEQELADSGLVQAEERVRAQLPWVKYLVKGTVRAKDPATFQLSLSLVDAESGQLRERFTGEGAYPSAIFSVIDEVGSRLVDELRSGADVEARARPAPPAGFTSMPEVALQFYKGIEHLAAGDDGRAFCALRQAVADDPEFLAARLWLIRTVRPYGLPHLVDALKGPVPAQLVEGMTRSSLGGEEDAADVIVAVITDTGLDAKAWDVLTQVTEALGQAPGVSILEPDLIPDLAAEADLSVSGMFAGDSALVSTAWIYSDVVLTFAFEGDGEASKIVASARDARTGALCGRRAAPCTPAGIASLVDGLRVDFRAPGTSGTVRQRKETDTPSPGTGCAEVVSRSFDLIRQSQGRKEGLRALVGCDVLSSGERKALWRDLYDSISVEDENAEQWYSTALWGGMWQDYRSNHHHLHSDELLDRFRVILDRFPDSVSASAVQYARAYALMSEGDLEASLKLLLSLANRPRSSDPGGVGYRVNLYYFLAVVARDSGQPYLALDYAERAAALITPDLERLPAFRSIAMGMDQAGNFGPFMPRTIQRPSGQYWEDLRPDLNQLLAELRGEVEGAESFDYEALHRSVVESRGSNRVEAIWRFLEGLHTDMLRRREDYTKPTGWQRRSDARTLLNELARMVRSKEEAARVRAQAAAFVSALDGREADEFYLAVGDYEKALSALPEKADGSPREWVELLQKRARVLRLSEGIAPAAQYLFEEFENAGEDPQTMLDVGFLAGRCCLAACMPAEAETILTRLNGIPKLTAQQQTSITYYLALCARQNGNGVACAELLREIVERTEAEDFHPSRGARQSGGAKKLRALSLDLLTVLRVSSPGSARSNPWMVELHRELATYIGTSLVRISPLPGELSAAETDARNLVRSAIVDKKSHWRGDEDLPARVFLRRHGIEGLRVLLRTYEETARGLHSGTFLRMLEEGFAQQSGNPELEPLRAEIVELFRKDAYLAHLAFEVAPDDARQIVAAQIHGYLGSHFIQPGLVRVIAEHRIEEGYDVLLSHLARNQSNPQTLAGLIEQLILNGDKQLEDRFAIALNSCLYSELNGSYSYPLFWVSKVAIRNGVAEGIVGLLTSMARVPEGTPKYDRSFGRTPDAYPKALQYLRVFVDFDGPDEAMTEYLMRRGAGLKWDAERRKYVEELAPEDSAGELVTFTISAPEARLVSVAGSFNGWNNEALLLGRQPNGDWRGSIRLPPGEVGYLFWVDHRRRPDPLNDQRKVMDGQRCSVLVVPDDIPSAAPPR